MNTTASARLVGRLAAVLFVGSGALTAATLALPQPHSLDRVTALLIAAAAVAIGGAAFVAPWQSWHPRATLALVPAALVLIAVGNYNTPAQPYSYGVFFIVVFVWIGLTQPRWTSLWFLAPAAAAYITPILLRPNSFPEALPTAALVIPVCGFVAESIAWIGAREHYSRERSAALARVALALGPQLNVETLSESLAAEMRIMLRAERATFFLLRGNVIERVYPAGYPDEARERLKSLEGYELGDNPGFAELAAGEPVLVEDPQNNPKLLRDPTRFGLRSYMAVPIIVEQELRGILSCSERTRARKYRDDDVQSAQALAAQAGAALRNALLYTQTLEASRHDHLTGLGNRRAFQEQLGTEVERARRYGRKLSLVVLDVDELKEVNDAWGHTAGDEVLERVAVLLKSGSRRLDGVYRIGGDEFALVLPETSVDNASIVAERVRRAVERGRVARDRDRDLTVSIGVSSFPEHGVNADELFERADTALYEVKRAGRNAVCTASTREAAGPGVRFGVDIHAVISERRLLALYQPIVDLDGGDVIAYEAFCRLDPSFGSAPTSTLFRAAASLGLTEAMDRCCRSLAIEGAREIGPNTQLFVNVSAAALSSKEFDLSDLVSSIHRVGLSPGQVVIEVTDHARTLGTSLLGNLSACQEAGLRLSLDDFGDTTSDLNVLASLPFDFVKIDMGVIRGDEDLRRRLVLGLLVVAREIGAGLLAEGIETIEELRLVRELGFQAAQGYFIKDPSPNLPPDRHFDLLPTA